jgi:GntR family transcriptional regulator, transcriptional repressor for pyruvate dehydrogenase complex
MPPMWKPVERRRIAEEVARQLRGLILKGQYQPGDKLPPERRLAETLGVNRATLREALRNLEHMGLVAIRQGDGTRVLDFIQTAGLDLLGHMISLSGDTGQAVLGDVLEFRLIAGRETARLAAVRATPEQITALEELAARDTATREDVLALDMDFYFQLARSTDNVVFPLLYNPVRTTVRRFVRFFTAMEPEEQEVRAHHAEILEALRARDPDAAGEVAEAFLALGRERFLATLEPEEEG